MKTTTTLLAACSLISAASLTSWADTAYTDPVMASSTTISGNASGTGMRLTTLGVSALNPIEATGVIASIDGVDANDYTTLTVTDVPSTWATNDFDNQGGVVEFNWRDVPLYFVTITSGDLEGQVLDVIATGSGATATLTVAGDLTGMDSQVVGATFEIRKAHTIAGVLGENNEAGLVSGGDINSSSVIYNMFGGDFELIYYQTDSFGIFGGTGWRLRGDRGLNVSDTRIDPDFGIVIGNRSSDALNVVSVGDVKIGAARSVIMPGLNALIYKYPVDTTLGESELYVDGTTSGISGGPDVATADIVYVLETAGNTSDWVIYYYQLDSFGIFGGNGWRRRGDRGVDVSDVVIKAGSVIIVNRRAETATTWSKLQPFTLN